MTGQFAGLVHKRMIKLKVLINAMLMIVSITHFSCMDEGGIRVSNINELNSAIAKAKPGDKIIMNNGNWKDVEIEFTGKGTKKAKIYLQARQPGKVIIEGKSNLRIAGEYLEVSGLVFKNGYTPTSEVISFKNGKDQLANHCRVTECVIDHFNNPERFESDTWVALYGKNNAFDHNTLVGKRNQGVTLAVKLNTADSRENNHRIAYNYFGPRPTLGSNGGETLRIGTSHYSLTYSNTTVDSNYFEHCNGELEIISNKSCGNIYKSNVFYECEGTLTMRHGNETVVENNYFLGNRKPNTGGIRVINEKQTVVNNYLYGLTGYRFRGALVVMNGVPDSPLNRYFQVVDSKIEGNLFVDCDHVQLCAGSDSERSAVPENTTIAGNIFLSETNAKPFTVYDDISGITFRDNVINQYSSPPVADGFESVDYQVNKNENGLTVPAEKVMHKTGVKQPVLPVTKDKVGASYYPKAFPSNHFGTGKEIPVEPGVNTLIEVAETSSPGDVLLLQNGQEYLMTKDFYLLHPLTIKAEKGEKAQVRSEKASFFRIENGGGLELINLYIDGKASPDQPGNSVVSTSKYSMTHNYKLLVKNCEVRDLDVNHSFDFLKTYKNTFADSVLIENTVMENISGAVMAFDKETEDLGIYNVEYALVKGSHFKDISGPVMNIYRGGTDESTFGPVVRIEQSKFINTGRGKRNKLKASIRFHGVQNAKIKNSSFSESAPVNLFLTNGEPITVFKDCQFHNTPKIESNSGEFVTENIVYSF